jgi:peroxisomal 3,2-trans-enoyl-CoA isomerase
MSEALVLATTRGRVRTLTMNNPRRLNGWTLPMQAALGEALDAAARDDEVGAVVLTGTGRYYSAGADLSGSIRLGHPRTLRALIVKANYELFDQFVRFPKPILAAINGVALGAPVTTAVLCDGIVAAEGASFSTPFARLKLPAEGCSSVLFPRLFGSTVAARMLGEEGWKPTAQEALEIGLVEAVVPADELLEAAQRIAEGWVAAGRPRTYRGGAARAELEAVNARESEEVADAFVSRPFLMGQARFLRSKGKNGPALTFLALAMTRPLWGRLL